MEDMFTRIVQNLVDRIHGPMNFRIVVQPLMAAIFAILDGTKDTREGRPPYFWALFTQAENRRALLRSGWKSVGKIFAVAFILDAIYQFRVIHWFYPGEALLVSVALAVIPYVLIRGPVSRIVRGRRSGRTYERT